MESKEHYWGIPKLLTMCKNNAQLDVGLNARKCLSLSTNVTHTSYIYNTQLKVCGCCRLFFLIVHLYLIGVWFGEDHKANTMKGTCFKESKPYLQFFLSTIPHSLQRLWYLVSRLLIASLISFVNISIFYK